uniref:Uncharacterized protein n=1 Tax=Triticum urartu TaxID=4572 RepID=A0A8R7PC68_TRIUA
MPKKRTLHCSHIGLHILFHAALSAKRVAAPSI